MKSEKENADSDIHSNIASLDRTQRSVSQNLHYTDNVHAYHSRCPVTALNGSTARESDHTFSRHLCLFLEVFVCLAHICPFVEIFLPRHCKGLLGIWWWQRLKGRIVPGFSICSLYLYPLPRRQKRV